MVLVLVNGRVSDLRHDTNDFSSEHVARRLTENERIFSSAFTVTTASIAKFVLPMSCVVSKIINVLPPNNGAQSKRDNPSFDC